MTAVNTGASVSGRLWALTTAFTLRIHAVPPAARPNARFQGEFDDALTGNIIRYIFWPLGPLLALCSPK